MIWQDYVLMMAGVVLTILLIPMIRDEDTSVPRKTSVPTTIALFVIAGTRVTLDLYLAATVSATTAIMWAYIALYRD